MSIRRDKIWFLVNDRDGRVAEVERELDCIDIEIDALRQIQYLETKARIERLGIDTTHFRPPPQMHRSEQRCLNHIGPNDDVEAIVKAATENKIDRLYREHIGGEEVPLPPVFLRRPCGGAILGVR